MDELSELRGKLSEALMNIHDQFASIYRDLEALRTRISQLEKQTKELVYPRRRSYLE